MNMADAEKTVVQAAIDFVANSGAPLSKYDHNIVDNFFDTVKNFVAWREREAAKQALFDQLDVSIQNVAFLHDLAVKAGYINIQSIANEALRDFKAHQRSL